MTRGWSTRARLAVAAALCLLSLGPARPSGRPVTVAITRFQDVHAVIASQPSDRVLLVLAALALLWCATGTRTPGTQRLARTAWVGIGVAAALAAGRGVSLTLLWAGLALALLAPLVRRRPASPEAVFVPGAAGR